MEVPLRVVPIIDGHFLSALDESIPISTTQSQSFYLSTRGAHHLFVAQLLLNSLFLVCIAPQCRLEKTGPENSPSVVSEKRFPNMVRKSVKKSPVKSATVKKPAVTFLTGDFLNVKVVPILE